MLSLIENYKGLVQLKMNLMIYIKQACSTAFDVNVFKAKVLSVPFLESNFCNQDKTRNMIKYIFLLKMFHKIEDHKNWL